MRKRDRQQIKELMILFALKTAFLMVVLLLMFWAVGYFTAQAASVMENAINGAYEATWKIYEALAK